jgi:hypothetical protein
MFKFREDNNYIVKTLSYLFYACLLAIAMAIASCEVLKKEKVSSSIICYSGGVLIYNDTIEGVIKYSNGEYFYTKGKVDFGMKADCFLAKDRK